LLTGACLARAGLNRHTGYATLVLTLAAECPDIDVLITFLGPVTGFAHHRGITHTLLGTLFDAALVLALVYLLHRWRMRRGKSTKLPPRWGLLYGYGVLGGLSHILLDFTNNYGVRPFAPFNWRWYSWDIVFIIEPLLLVALVLGLLLPELFGLVGSEIGARGPRFRGRGWATATLIFMVLLWGVRDHYHRVALTALDSMDYGGERAVKVAAEPYPTDPTHWAGVVETRSAIRIVPLAMTAAGSASVADEDRQKVYYKPEETPATLAAKKSPLGRVYLDWAVFPYTETESSEEVPGGWVVRFRDLRYGYMDSNPRRSLLGARVELDHNLNVVAMWVGTRKQ
jgi:inner membrane protein